MSEYPSTTKAPDGWKFKRPHCSKMETGDKILLFGSWNSIPHPFVGGVIQDYMLVITPVPEPREIAYEVLNFIPDPVEVKYSCFEQGRARNVLVKGTLYLKRKD